jgi:hypothetical protein
MIKVGKEVREREEKFINISSHVKKGNVKSRRNRTNGAIYQRKG